MRVLNPGFLPRLLNGSELLGGAAKVFEGFRGRKAKSVSLLEAKPGTPKTVAELGGLEELTLDAESENSRVLGLLNPELDGDENDNTVWEFDRTKVKLVADARGDMHIVGFYVPLPSKLRAGQRYFLGCVVSCCYFSDKPHLYKIKTKLSFRHDFCEDGIGEYPSLHFKDGFLFFSGGTYSITPAGIEG